MLSVTGTSLTVLRNTCALLVATSLLETSATLLPASRYFNAMPGRTKAVDELDETETEIRVQVSDRLAVHNAGPEQELVSQ